MKLIYEGKETAEDILASIKTVPSRQIQKFRQGKKDGWFNQLIYGDNLIALKSLLQNKGVKNCVRLVYIDPPFSTLQNFNSSSNRVSTVSRSRGGQLAYSDMLGGSPYLEFIRKRLILLRDIMAEDATIYLHIDWKMGHYAKVIMDEIFGQENFINDIARIKCNPKNFERRAFGNIKDMILLYAKSGSYVWNEPKETYRPSQLRKLFPKKDVKGRSYTTNPLHAPGETLEGPTGMRWRNMVPPEGRHWRYPPHQLDELDKKGLIEWSASGNPRKIIFADEYAKKKMKRQDIWEFKDPPRPTYPTEKNLEMLKVIINASSNVGDIVLDCFCGSGTALLAAELLGRRWIGIDDSPLAIKASRSKLQVLKGAKPFVVSSLDGSPPLD